MSLGELHEAEKLGPGGALRRYSGHTSENIADRCGFLNIRSCAGDENPARFSKVTANCIAWRLHVENALISLVYQPSPPGIELGIIAQHLQGNHSTEAFMQCL